MSVIFWNNNSSELKAFALPIKWMSSLTKVDRFRQVVWYPILTSLFFYILLIFSNVSYLSLGLGGGNCHNSITMISIAWLVLLVFSSSQAIFDYACFLRIWIVFPTNLCHSGPQHLHSIYYASTVTGVNVMGCVVICTFIECRQLMKQMIFVYNCCMQSSPSIMSPCILHRWHHTSM